MIVLGDWIGGSLYLLTLVFEIFFLLWGKLAAGTIAQWDNLQLAEVKNPSNSALPLRHTDRHQSAAGLPRLQKEGKMIDKTLKTGTVL